MRFVDTNVLLYAISRAPEERGKAQRANDLLADPDLALSVQVLQEFYVQATRASRPDRLSHEQASRLVESFLRFTVQEVTRDLTGGKEIRRARGALHEISNCLDRQPDPASEFDV